MLQNIIERFALISLSIDFHTGKTSILIQRDAPMVQQVAIVDLVKTSLGIEETHMAL